MNKTAIFQNDTVTIQVEYDPGEFAFDPGDYTIKMELRKAKDQEPVLEVPLESSSDLFLNFKLSKNQAAELIPGDYYVKVVAENDDEHYTVKLDNEKLEVIL